MDIGYRYRLVGNSDMMSRIFGEIVKAVILAIVLIYMVLAAEFESFSQPFVIMMSLPFAIIGAVLGLLVANQTGNMMSLIGATMLLGLVTKNAILLVDYANQAREKGMPIKEAILEACSLRLPGHDSGCAGNRRGGGIAAEHGRGTDRRFDDFHLVDIGGSSADLHAHGRIQRKKGGSENCEITALVGMVFIVYGKCSGVSRGA